MTKTMNAPKGYMSAKAAAEMLGLTANWLYRLKAERKIPFYRIGGRVFFKEEDLQAYIESSRVEVLDKPC